MECCYLGRKKNNDKNTLLGEHLLFIVLLTTSGCYFFTSRPEPKITWKINRDGKWETLMNGKDNFEIADAFHGRLLNIISVKHKIHQTKYRCEAENSKNVGNPKVYDIQLRVKGKWP